MIHIKVTCGAFEAERFFPKTPKGNADSIKWLTDIYDEVRNGDSYFFKHREFISARNLSEWTYYGYSDAQKKVANIEMKRERLFEVDPPLPKRYTFKVETVHI